MLTQERKRLILTQLKEQGRIVAKDLSRRLKLSEDTIRRDLRELASDGLLQRVHGGALPASPTVANLASRRSMSVSEKIKLGRAGARLLKNGQSVFVDGGTTNLELIRALPIDLKLSLFTHSPTIAAALENHTNIDVVLIGGKLFKHSMVSVGAAAVQAIEMLHVDVFFMGVTGVHPREGLTTGDYEEAIIKRAIAGRAAEVVSLVSTEKLGAASTHRIVELKALTTLVVDKSAKIPHLKLKGLSILRA
jgi:DeoR/GlpR family transcriptional regulator of sugar metabolism